MGQAELTFFFSASCACFFRPDPTKVKDDLPGAEKCYRAAIEVDPQDKDAERRLAKVVPSHRM